MNFFEFHIGDYAEATGHLSCLEDGVYGRLIRKYYATEQPLPKELISVQRLCGAKNKVERLAVEAVLSEFFELLDDGWHNSRCDREIARFQSMAPERAARKANEEARLRRHRDERMRLFDALRVVGQHPEWNIPMGALKEMHARFCNAPETAPATFQVRTCNGDKNGPATASHIPLPTSHIPLPSTEDTEQAAPRGPRAAPRSFHDEVIAAYHRLCPNLPGIKAWPKHRKAVLDARIRERCEEGKPADKIGYWESFFETVKASDFLSGRTDKPFRPNIDWLIGPQNFCKVIEGNYDNRKPNGAHAHG